MMLDELRDRLRAMTPEKMGEIINRAIKKNESRILDLNRQDQLFNRGVNYNEDRIIPEYSERTKRKKGYERVTLHDTGTWYKHFTIFYRPYEIEISALPEILNRSFDLTSHLRERYGKEIIGISDKNIKEIIYIIKDEIIEDIRKWV